MKKVDERVSLNLIRRTKILPVISYIFIPRSTDKIYNITAALKENSLGENRATSSILGKSELILKL